MMSSSSSAPSERPARANLSGVWQVDKARSDSLSPLLEKHFGWLGRWLIPSADVTTKISHHRLSLTLVDSSNLGEFSQSLTLDGKWRPVLQVDQSEADMCCIFDRNHLLRMESHLSDGELSDVRELVKRTVMKQTLTFLPKGASSSSSSSSSSAGKKQRIVLTRFFNKVETEEEKVAGEAAEILAHTTAMHQEARLQLLTTGAVDGSWDVERLLSGIPGRVSVPVFSTGSSAQGAPRGSSSEVFVPLPTSVSHSTVITGEAVRGRGVPTAQPPPSTTPPSSLRPLTCDFSGKWMVDAKRSDSMEAMFTLLGMGWLARKAILSIEVTTVMKHDVPNGSMSSQDFAMGGVVGTNSYTFDGEPRTVVDKEGKKTIVTASLLSLPSSSLDRTKGCVASSDSSFVGSFGVMKLHSLLEDGTTTVDMRYMMEEGKTMRQCVVVTKGGSGSDKGKTVTTNRFLKNMEYNAASWKGSVEAYLASEAAVAPREKPKQVSLLPSSSTHTSVSSVILPASPVSSSSRVPSLAPAAPERPLSSDWASRKSPFSLPSSFVDPFFASLAGHWSLSSTSRASHPIDPFLSSLGRSWARCLNIFSSAESMTITHAAPAKEAGGAEGFLGFEEHANSRSNVVNAPPVVSPFGSWVRHKTAEGLPFYSKAIQTSGRWDEGSRWMGDEVGYIPEAWILAAATNGRSPPAVPSRPLPKAATATAGNANTRSALLSAHAPPSVDTAAVFENEWRSPTSATRLSRPGLSNEALEHLVNRIPLKSIPISVLQLTARVSVVITLGASTEGTGLAFSSPQAFLQTMSSECHPDAIALLSRSPEGGDVLSPSALSSMASGGALFLSFELLQGDALQVTYAYADGTGRILASASRAFTRKDDPEVLEASQIAEAARLDLALTMLRARRSAGDTCREAYEQQILSEAVAAAAAAAAAAALSAGGEASVAIPAILPLQSPHAASSVIPATLDATHARFAYHDGDEYDDVEDGITASLCAVM